MAKPTSGIFGQPVRAYVEAVELPWLLMVGGVALIYVVSYWLGSLDILTLPPLVLFLQVLGSAICAYLVGVKQGNTWSQTALACALVGFSGGVVSAVLALFRFWHFWLVFNIVVEPVWSGLLGAAVGLVTLGFFHLPLLIKRLQAFTN
jgi:hypothetical protein